MTLRRFAAFFSALGFLTLAHAVRADEPHAGLGQGRLDLEQAIHDYILKNPKVIKEALERAELEEQVDNTKRILKSRSADLYAVGSLTVGAGPAQVKVSIVEFFDYNCPYCRKVYPGLKTFLSTHPDTRIVLKDVATFGKDSEAAARLVIAATQQGKALALHEALMANKGRVTEAVTLSVATSLGLDIEQLKKVAASDETSRKLEDTRKLADTMGVTGTPLFIIGHNGIPGAPDDLMERLEKFVAEVRTQGCDVC